MDLKNINLMNDALFKAIMCHEKNRELVIDLLHALTSIPKEVLKKGEFISGEEIPKRKVYEKKQMTDFNIKLENKRRIIVEMNQNNHKTLFDKNSTYAFSVILESTHKNIEEYPKVILINIDNFNKYKTEKPLLEFKIQDKEGHIETDMYKSIHLILENINKRKYNVDKEILKFAEFLKIRNLEEMLEEFRGDEKYMAALRTVEDLTTDPNLIGYYDYEEAKEQELRIEKIYARKEGLEEGREEGKKEGAIEIAKKMLAKGKDKEEIIEFTGLSLNEINNL